MDEWKLNVITRRTKCLSCGREYDVTPRLGGCWREVMVNQNSPVPYIISARRPVCVVPECKGVELADMNSERVDTADGKSIVIMSCEMPRLN